jgi:hypothetical protein
MLEKENILRILKETSVALKSGNSLKIKELSNQTVHSASIEQDTSSINIAVLLYSISKILEREEYKREKNWDKFYKKFNKSLDLAILYLEKNDIKKFKYFLKTLRDQINNLSGNLKIYIEDVFRKAEINKASKIYEHGISMEQTAKLLGVSLWELANYTGQKTLLNSEPESKTFEVKNRIKITEDFFKK